MSASNKLLKERRPKATTEGPFTLEPSLLSKLEALVASSNTDAALVTFASAIPAAAALTSAKSQAVAARDLAQEALEYANKPSESDVSSHFIASEMIQLLCDLITSPAARSIHRPLLWSLKTLPGSYLILMITYLTENIFQLIGKEPALQLIISPATNANGISSSNGMSAAVLPAVDVTYTVDALLVFPEYRSVIQACSVSLATHVVLSLEHAVYRASHALSDSGPLSYHLTEAVNERVSVLHALLTVFKDGLAQDIEAAVEEKKVAFQKAEAAVTAALHAQDNAAAKKSGEKEISEDLSAETIVSAAVALHAAAAPPGMSTAAAVGAGVLINTALLSTSASASSLYIDETEDSSVIDYEKIYTDAVDEVKRAEAELHCAKAEASALPLCICRGAKCLLSILKHGSLPIETMSSVAVALCSAVGLPKVTASGVCAAVGAGLLLDGAILSSANLGDEVAEGWVGSSLIQKGASSLGDELRCLGPVPALCMLRGLLQGTPLEALTAPLTLVKGQKWNLMTDGIIETLCNVITTAVDPEFKYLALQSLNICLDRLTQQWGVEKGGKSGGKKEKKEGKAPMVLLVPTPASLTDAQQKLVLRVLWSCWDESQPRATRLAHSAFSQLLKMVELQSSEEKGKRGKDNVAAFWESVARDLLALGTDQKRRYAPLAALVPHMGGSALLRLRPNLIEETLSAMVANSSASSPGATMLRVLWSSLWEEALTAAKGDKVVAVEAWRAYWVPQVAEILWSNTDAARHIVCAYIVPVLVEIDPKVVEVLIESVATAPEEIATPAVVLLLSTGRKLHLISDLESISIPIVTSSDDATPTPQTAATPQLLDIHALLRRAVTHRSEALRSGALQLACVHPRTSALPSIEELTLVQEALNMDLHTTSPSVRQKTIAPLGRLLHRMRIAVGAVLTRPRDFPPGSLEDVARCQAWLQSLSAGILASAYPGAQYGRKFMAVDMICMFLEVFGDVLPPNESPHASRAGDAALPRAFRRKGPLAAMRKGDGAAGAKLTPESFCPFPADFFSESTVKVLLSCLLDSWDKIREGAGEALLLLPSPLPGIDTPEEVLKLMQLGLNLLRSPRLKDADAGARIIVLIFQQYVMGLGWRCGVHPAVVHVPSAKHDQARNGAVLDFLGSVVGLVANKVEAGEADLGAASRESLAHGPLLALRYLVPAVPWDALLTDQDTSSTTQAIATRLLSALRRLNNLILPILSTPEEMNNVGAADVDANDVEMSTITAAVEDHMAETDDFGDDVESQLVGPEAQIITCACWMSAKELSLVIGTLCQQAPVVLIPASFKDAKSSPTPALLAPTQLDVAGELLIRALIETKHSGAVDKTQQGFEALASTLMGADPSTSLAELPAQWLTRVMNHLRRPGQSRRDIIRRSAGLPYAIQALMRALPLGGSRVLAARGFQELLATAAAENLAECWPRVHALNTLRMVYSDTELGQEALPFHSMGLQVSITALAAPEWDVRNSAMLCYTTLLIRVLGFSNLATRDVSGKRAATAADFFAAHPTLHPFLLGQLQKAAEALEAGEKDLYPSLSPILTLLMRMKPAGGTGPSSFTDAPKITAANGGSQNVASEDKSQLPALVVAAAGDRGDSASTHESGEGQGASLTPEAFIPLVQRCAAARPMFVRQQAAKALAPLVPAEKIAQLVGGLATEVAAALKNAGSSWNANHIQGQIFQLVELVRVLEDTTTPAAAAEQAVDVLASIATPLQSTAVVCAVGRYPCPPVSHALLRLAEAMAALAVATNSQQKAASAVSFILAASESAWQSVVDTTTIEENEIMLGVALKEATLLRLLWSPLVGNCLELSAQWVDEVTTALQHTRSEVRTAALKAALRLLGQGNTPTGAVLPQLPKIESCALRAVLEVHAARETHPKSLRRTLHVLSLLPAPQLSSEALQVGKNFDASNSFIAIAKHAQHAVDPITRSYALVCLGPLLPIAPSEKLSLEDAAAIVTALATEFCTPDQLPEFRSAVVSMLGASGLLAWPFEFSKKLQELQIDAWDALLCLLEDEDPDVRGAAAETAVVSMSAWDGAPSKDACVEKINSVVLRVLSSRLGPTPALLDLLRRRVCDLEPTRIAQHEALETAAAEPSALTGRLFEFERDNHHEEPLMQSQLSAQALALLVPSLSKGSPDNSETLDWAVEAASILRDAARSAGWQALSGFLSVSEVESAFSPAYCLVLAVWVGGHCVSEELQREEMLGLLAELNSCGAFKQGLGRNPLLRGAWSAAVRLWLKSPVHLIPGENVGENIQGGDAAGAPPSPLMWWEPTGFLFNIISDQDSRKMALLAELAMHEKAAEENSIEDLIEIIDISFAHKPRCTII